MHPSPKHRISVLSTGCARPRRGNGFNDSTSHQFQLPKETQVNQNYLTRRVLNINENTVRIRFRSRLKRIIPKSVLYQATDSYMKGT